MWFFNGNEFTEDMIGDNYGFVYLITNLQDGRKYVGKKFFYSSKSKQVKGKKKRIKVQSNWKTYYGSNKELNEDVSKIGKDQFKREILHLCKTKGECGYLEAQEQFDRRVLLDDNYYNIWIMCRVHSTHVKGLINDVQL